MSGAFLELCTMGVAFLCAFLSYNSDSGVKSVGSKQHYIYRNLLNKQGAKVGG